MPKNPVVRVAGISAMRAGFRLQDFSRLSQPTVAVWWRGSDFKPEKPLVRLNISAHKKRAGTALTRCPALTPPLQGVTMLRSRYTGCIYIAINRRNRRAYIGKTLMPLSRRRTSHHVAAKSGKGSVFHAALRKYGKSAFDWSTLFESDCEATLFDAEVSLIADYRANGVLLYNMSAGGEGASIPCSEARRQKLKVTMKGRRKSVETREKLSIAHRGRPKSAAHIASLRACKLGKRLPPWTPERRAKMEAVWAKWRAEKARD